MESRQFESWKAGKDALWQAVEQERTRRATRHGKPVESWKAVGKGRVERRVLGQHSRGGKLETEDASSDASWTGVETEDASSDASWKANIAVVGSRGSKLTKVSRGWSRSSDDCVWRLELIV